MKPTHTFSPGDCGHASRPPAILPGRARTGSASRLIQKTLLLGITSFALSGFGAAPSITTPPASQIILVGDDASFSVVATGTPTLSYQWRQNGINVAGATKSNLALAAVTPLVAGNYTVVVTNSSGSVTSTPAAVLSVRDTFGYATAETFFSFDDISTNGTRVLTNADDESVNVPFGFNFIFYDRGYSNVFVSPNGLLSFGAAESSSATVNLTNAAPAGNHPAIAVLWDDWQTLTNRSPHGDGVYYRTSGTPGSRRFVIQWNNVFGYVSSEEGSPSGVTFQAVILENSRQIVLQYLDVNTDDSRTNGNTAAVGLRDTDGQLNGKNLQWSFNQPIIEDGQALLFTFLTTDPMIDVTPVDRTNVAGTTASFTVSASGSTTLGYRWQSNGMNLANGGNISGATTATLTITNVAASNAANYTVVVTNSHGKVVSATAGLTVATPPAITTQPLSQTNVVGTGAEFNVAATGSPLIYRWQKNTTNLVDGGNVSGTTTATLTLANLQTGDAGNYTVTITNLAGTVTSSNAALVILPAIPLATALDTTGLIWTTGGDATWYGQPLVTHDGVDAAQAKHISANQEAWIQTTVTGPVSLSFWWKVSSEADFDLLEIYVGGIRQAFTSGEVDWQQQTVSVPAGAQIVRWRYAKDASQNAGLDTAWVDQISFSTAPQPFNLSAVSRLPDNTVQFQLNGESGRSYIIEYSTNLTAWFSLTNFTATNATMSLLDPTVGPAQRFYRGVTVITP